MSGAACSRCLQIFFVALLCIGLSGCVYLRLSKAVAQFKYPEQAISSRELNGNLRCSLSEPIVLVTDLNVLLGMTASKIGENSYEYSFNKSGPQDRHPWKFQIWSNKQDIIEEFELPPRVYEIFGKELIIEGIRALGWGEVSLRKRTYFLNIKFKADMPSFIKLMGEPQARDGDIMIYQFESDGSNFEIKVWGKELLQKLVLRSQNLFLESTFLNE